MKPRAKTLFIPALALFAGLAIALAAQGGSASAEPAWKVVAAGRSVESRPQGETQTEWLPVTRGDELQPSTVVRTGRRSRATLTRAGSVMIVDGNSEVELPGTGTGEAETAVIQQRGSVLYEVEGKDHPHFEVVTPYLVAGVKGTSFLVTVDEEHASVTVESGVVEVTHARSGRRTEVHAGESVLQQRDDLEMDLVDQARRGEHPELRADERKLESLDNDRRWFRKVIAHDDDFGDAAGAAAGAKDERRYRGLGVPADDQERKFRGLNGRGHEEQTRQEEREQEREEREEEREERLNIHDELLDEQEEDLKPGRPDLDDEGPDRV